MPTARPSGVTVNPDALLSATEAAKLLPRTRFAVGMWRARGKLQPAGRRGRSPLYRWADLVALERDTSRRAA